LNPTERQDSPVETNKMYNISSNQQTGSGMLSSRPVIFAEIIAGSNQDDTNKIKGSNQELGKPSVHSAGRRQV
jgi:hypothetical protein